VTTIAGVTCAPAQAYTRQGEPDMPEGARTVSLYHRDYYAWALDQAARLRDLARRGASTELDLENLAEEVEDLGKSDRDAVLSQIARIMAHFLKLEYSPSDQPRGAWEESIVEAREQIGRKLTPTLRRLAGDELAAEYATARKLAAAGLKRYGEQTYAANFPACPYTLNQVIDEEWFPERRR
jgi:hypothetical protein